STRPRKSVSLSRLALCFAHSPPAPPSSIPSSGSQRSSSCSRRSPCAPTKPDEHRTRLRGNVTTQPVPQRASLVHPETREGVGVPHLNRPSWPVSARSSGSRRGEHPHRPGSLYFRRRCASSVLILVLLRMPGSLALAVWRTS